MTIKHDGDVKLSLGRSRYDTTWKNRTLRWSEVLDKLKQTTRTRETQLEFIALPKSKQDDIKDVGGFVGGWLKDGKRRAENILTRSLITLDADYATMDLLDTLQLYYGCAAAAYSTHKHTVDKPRLRLIIPLSREVSGEEYEAASRMLAQELGIDLFDDTTYQPTRLMYWPSTSADAPYYFDYVDAAWLDPDELLGRYPDWTDTSCWPVSSRTATQQHKRAQKQGDPTEKDGVLGAFCRVYDVPDAISAFLPETYIPCASEGRYTYTQGSTSAGLVIYDGGKFAYSNHATDPINGKLCNAFDLVRIHRFRDLDEDVDPKTPITAYPSYKAMRDFALEDEKVKVLLTKERMDKARKDFDLPLPEEDVEWVSKLSYNKQGLIENTINNACVILENDPALKGCLAYNEFVERVVCMLDTPWKRVTDPINGDPWSDADDSELRRYLELGYQITGKDRIMDAVTVCANRHKIHPIRTYLEGLEWDGTERLDRLLVEYLDAPDTAYVRAVTRKVFTAAVARIRRPGCKFDYVLVLSGGQGIGKSTLIQKMSRGWYTDSLAGVGGKEAYEGIQNYWLVELAELAAMKKTEIETVKNFVSKQVDSYRAAYGRRVEDHKRKCVFIGTTNSTAFLRDDTGNRRFWPVSLGKEKDIWERLTDDIIDQLWAEAVIRYEHGEPLVLPRKLEAEAMEQQKVFTDEDPRTGMVREYLATLLPESWSSKTPYQRRAWFLEDASIREVGVTQRTKVCASEVWVECFGMDESRLDRRAAAEIKSILRSLEGWSERSNTNMGPYGNQRYFEWGTDIY